MFYRKVYPAAWQHIRRNPSLLFFGFFASLLGWHEVKLLFALNDTSPDFLSSTFNFWIKLFSVFAASDISWQTLPALLGLILIFVLLAAIVILTIASQGALIKSTAEKNGRGKNKLADYMYLGVAKFWPLFGLHAVNILIGYFFVITIVNPMITYAAMSGDLLQYLVLSLIVFFFFFPMIVIISFVTRYGMAFIMIKNQNFLDAFANSWVLFKIHWLLTIENAIVITVITVLFLLAMATSMVFVFVPFFFLSVFVGTLNPALHLLVVLLGTLAALIVLILASAFYGAYYNIAWARVFIELVGGREVRAKIYRLGQKHLSSH